MIPFNTQPIKSVWKSLPRLLFIVMAFVSGCASPANKDYQLNAAFSGESAEGCNQICWFGIQVGTTSRERALEIIKGVSWIDQSTLKSSDEAINVEWFTETTKEFRSYAQLNLEAGIIDSIEITGVMPFTTADFISFLGEPTEIGITPWRGMHGESLTSYVLYYPTRNLEVYVAAGSGDGPQPRDDVSMVGTDLVFKGEIKQQPWLGYGQLDKYLAP